MAESELAIRKIYRYLDTVGDGSGIKSADVNGSGTQVDFKITCPEGKLLELQRMIVYVTDVGKLQVDKYGKDIVMTNGITCEVRDPLGAPLIDMFDGIPVKTNMDWSAICYDTLITNGGTQDVSSMSVRWTFSETGQRLALRSGESLVVTINDNLSALTDHRFFVQGEVRG